MSSVAIFKSRKHKDLLPIFKVNFKFSSKEFKNWSNKSILSTSPYHYLYIVWNKYFLKQFSVCDYYSIIHWLNCQIKIKKRISCTHCYSICLYKSWPAKVELLVVKHISSASIMHSVKGDKLVCESRALFAGATLLLFQD